MCVALSAWSGRLCALACVAWYAPSPLCGPPCRTYWSGYRLQDLPPESLAGAAHCLALLPTGVRREDAVEAAGGRGGALVLRLKDEAGRADLRLHLLRSKALVAAVAGRPGEGEGGGGSTGGASGRSGMAQGVRV